MSNTSLTIHSDPMPEAKRGSIGCIYPFNELQIGQCFYVPVNINDDIKKLKSSISAGSRYWAKKNKMKFATRYIRERQKIGVWRIA